MVSGVLIGSCGVWGLCVVVGEGVVVRGVSEIEVCVGEGCGFV